VKKPTFAVKQQSPGPFYRMTASDWLRSVAASVVEGCFDRKGLPAQLVCIAAVFCNIVCRNVKMFIIAS